MARREIGIEQLRLLPPEDVVDVLTRRPEDQWFDRASARTDARALGDLMVAFANAEGGIVALGVHDGRIEGISGADVRRMNSWRQAALDFTEPPVRHRVELVACVNARGASDQLFLVEVESSERVHINVRGETLLRVGDETRRLGPLEAQELRYDKGESTFDGSPVPDSAINDLDAGLVKLYSESIRARSSAETVLRARGLATERQGHVIPTVAGMLLLGTEPQRWFPEAFIRVLRYGGSSRETGSRANVRIDRRFEGPLGTQIDGARRLLRRGLLPSTIRLQPDGRFRRSSDIPEFAWLEAIVNAVTHRSYSAGGDHVRVEVFDDRVEVESPGRLPGLVRLENIRSTRFARNPRISRALSDLGYGRELGEGVDRMFEEMSRAGLPDPVFEQGPASVRVILLADLLVRRILDRLPPGSERFGEYLSRVGRVTTTEATELLAVSRPTVLKHFRQLERERLLEHVGSSANDPRGYWRAMPSPSAP